MDQFVSPNVEESVSADDGAFLLRVRHVNRVRRVLLICVAAAALACCCFAATPKLNIRLKNGTSRELETKVAVARLAAQYDLTKYTLTRDIVVEQGAMAHSHPVLTMNCRFLGNDDLLLSQYIHEQGHWALMRHHQDVPRLLLELKALFPNLPTEYPDGGFDERGTYVHVAVNLLEWQGLEEVIGPERARKVMEWKKGDHYKAIYAAVLDNREKVENVLKRYDVKF